jgi:hypothetical protein
MTDRRHYSAPRDRSFLFERPERTPGMEGFVHFGMSSKLPKDACAEMRIGYADYREEIISTLTAMDGEIGA